MKCPLQAKGEIMEKRALLKKAGFSDEFIAHLKSVEDEGLYDFQNHIYSVENFDVEVHDTSELYVGNQLQKDTTTLEIK